MRIGFEAKRIFQNVSGLGNYSRNTLSILVRYYPGNRYVLFAPKITNLYYPGESVEIISPTSGFMRKFRFLWRLFKVSSLIKTNKIDLFHGLSNVLPVGISRTGIPSVLTVHDLIFLRFPQFYKRFDRFLYRMISVPSCYRATRIIAISKQTKNDLVELLKIDPAKIEVIYQSCDITFYEKISGEQKEIVRQKFELPENFILSVGTIEQRKNQLAILEGVVKEKLDIPVVILGKPTEYKRQMDEFIAESGIRKQLIFLHSTDLTELKAIYQMADLMVYPSLYEGFGLPVLEAQASGCPVITSNCSSLPEAGGEGALYINPKNSGEIGKAIREVLTNKVLRDDLIQKGAANSLLFNDRQVAEKVMKLYQSLV